MYYCNIVNKKKIERREREVTNDALVRLLEDTCNRIDDNFRK